MCRSAQGIGTGSHCRGGRRESPMLLQANLDIGGAPAAVREPGAMGSPARWGCRCRCGSAAPRLRGRSRLRPPEHPEAQPRPRCRHTAMGVGSFCPLAHSTFRARTARSVACVQQASVLGPTALFKATHLSSLSLIGELPVLIRLRESRERRLVDRRP